MNIAGSAVQAQAFTQAIENIPAKRLVIVLDCCHAERMATASRDMVRLESLPGFEMAAAPKNLVAVLKRGGGRAVYSSSLGNQPSWSAATGRGASSLIISSKLSKEPEIGPVIWRSGSPT